VFFVPAYLAALLFILSVAAGERALFGPRAASRPNSYARPSAPRSPCSTSPRAWRSSGGARRPRCGRRPDR
jgi:hypothetical protein